MSMLVPPRQESTIVGQILDDMVDSIVETLVQEEITDHYDDLDSRSSPITPTEAETNEPAIWTYRARSQTIYDEREQGGHHLHHVS